MKEKILKFDEILDRPKSTHYQKYTIYLEKYLMYQGLFNYVEAENNLKKAEREASVAEHDRERAVARVQLENLSRSPAPSSRFHAFQPS